MAGHSKWANIKRKKGREDERRGKLFSKLSKRITVAARNGGSDPEMNSELRLAIQKAKDNNMPNDNIDRAIKRATGILEGFTYESFVYEGYGPGGAAVYLELMSDNRNRTASEIRHLFSKHGGNLGEQGCVAWMFARKGQITIDYATIEMDKDDLMLQIIDSGAEDYLEEDDTYIVYTLPTDLEAVKKNLEDAGILLAEVDISMVPENTVTMEEKEARKILKLMDALEDHDDVQAVYSNFNIPEDLMEELAD